MMKKILVFMFILGLVSSANAAIVTIKGNGDSGTVTVSAGDTVAITVISDTDSTAGYTLSLTETRDNVNGYVTATALGVINTGFSVARVNGTLRNTMTTSTVTSLTNRYMIIDKASGATVIASTVTAGSVLYSFDALVPTAGEIGDTWTITMAVGAPVFSGANYTHNMNAVAVATTNALTLEIVPEPMTIALLGLGGLFLRRRR